MSNEKFAREIEDQRKWLLLNESNFSLSLSFQWHISFRGSKAQNRDHFTFSCYKTSITFHHGSSNIISITMEIAQMQNYWLNPCHLLQFFDKTIQVIQCGITRECENTVSILGYISMIQHLLTKMVLCRRSNACVVANPTHLSLPESLSFYLYNSVN